MNIKLLVAKISPIHWFVVALILMVLLAYFMPLSHLIYIPLRVLGGLLFLAGIAVIYETAKQFDQAGTPIKPFQKPTTIITTGLYRYSRNPIYIAMLVSLVGAWIALAALSPLLVIIGFFYLLQECYIKQEEIFLEAELPNQYLDYKYKVRRWL